MWLSSADEILRNPTLLIAVGVLVLIVLVSRLLLRWPDPRGAEKKR